MKFGEARDPGPTKGGEREPNPPNRNQKGQKPQKEKPKLKFSNQAKHSKLEMKSNCC